MGIFDQLKGLVGAGMGKIALTALHKNLESLVNHPVLWFQLIYEKPKEEIYFIVLLPDNSKVKCEFADGKNFIGVIESMSKEKLGSDTKIDVLVLEYDNTLKLITGEESKQPYKIIAAYQNAQGEKIKIEEPIK